MIVAVTGSSGFIGSRLVAKLKTNNHELIELDIQTGFDVLDYNQMKTVRKFDVCIHLAALTFVPLSFEVPHDFYMLNTHGLINCIELCRLHDARMIFASSYVYGQPHYLPINEDHPLEGLNPYTETKILGETICANYFKYFGVKSIILRPFNVYGQGQNEKFLLPSILNQAKNGKIKLNDPRPKRDFVFVDDVVDCYVKAVENNNIPFDVFNIGSGKSYSVSEVVGMVNELYGNTLDVEFSNQERVIEVFDTVADISKVKLGLDWSPKTDLFEGIKKILHANG
ncbi:MAG: NAD(P)-dependent oxidoreductase [Bacteroidales bacterium]|nr:NAD(P)-dependent oxidoreductase [Bacteroidales bacterium]